MHAEAPRRQTYVWRGSLEDAIAELEGAVEELTAVLTLLENGGKL